MAIERISDPTQLGSVIEAARAAGRCALDTEFVWERTYAPALCLIQLSVDDRVAVIDPLEGAPTEPVAELVADPAVVKLMHAPGADLAAFVLHHGIRPRSVRDTQLAAGFAGLGGSLSLERLLEAAIGVHLRHDEGFTDWQRRPLTPAQVAYAADDVVHLAAASDELDARLARLGREAWLSEEELARYGPNASLVQDPDAAWTRVSGRGKLRGEQLGVLRSVAAWREREARRRDLPASWLIKDATLIEVARRRPSDARQALAIRGLQLRRGAQLDGLLDAVRHPVAGDGERPPEPSSDVRRRIRVVLPLASAVLQACSAQAGIASELVATRADLESLIDLVATGGDDHPLLHGWRREVAGEPLLELLNGRTALVVLPRAPHVAFQPREP